MKVAAIALMALALSGCAKNLADVMERHEGKTAKQIGLKHSTLWCADAANLARQEVGTKPTGSRRAIDQKIGAVPVSVPQRGDILITKRKGGHHVDIVQAVLSPYRVQVIGGNIPLSRTDPSVVASYSRPIGVGQFYRLKQGA